MLDLFTIFSKGGIVLWYFQSTSQVFTPSVNALIKSIVLQERGADHFTHDSLALKYKLDNEFELVFVVAYQKILQLSYVDKFLSTVQQEFRDKYKNDLQQGTISRSFDFEVNFDNILRNAENESKQEAKEKKQMKTFQQSEKSKKTVTGSGLLQNENTRIVEEEKKKKEKKGMKGKEPAAPTIASPVSSEEPQKNGNGGLTEEELRQNREKFFNRGKKPKTKDISKSPTSPSDKGKKGKTNRIWDLNGTNAKDAAALNRSNISEQGDLVDNIVVSNVDTSAVGTMGGQLQDIDESSSEDEEEEEEEIVQNRKKEQKNTKKSGGFGLWSGLRNLVGSKTLSREDILPCLDRMRDHLISKNVASEVADKLCDSVAGKLEGRVLGTFSSVANTVKTSLQESCVQLLSPRRRVDILRDAMDAKQNGRPYVVTFCGVNGVGKSTNLAKVCFWLVENGFRVMIAACDTFRAGAVEQLRTHKKRLNAMHPATAHSGQVMVELYEKGYGKDAAGIAMQAISHARDTKFDVVLVDTAGRMQDNEPLMRALSKLIKINQPDLVLFVGEALVGNDAIDQLVKFNQSLADFSQAENPHIIDGIVLTKFDTIDDKVGAAVSMTYITGQPIVFVGTGQTYTDLKNLNAHAVVHSLLKA